MNISWLKLDLNILDDAKIKIIRKHPDGDAVFVLWIGLLCLAMKSQRPGIIEISDGIPYSIDDLSNLFNIEKKTVEMGIALFSRYRMIEILDDETIDIINFRRHQSIEEIERNRENNRIRQKRYREQLRISNALVTRDTVTCNATDIDIEIDKKKKKIFLSDSDEIRLSELLFSEIQKRNPNHKIPNLQVWAKNIDLMIRIDKRDLESIKKVIVWAQRDSFWQNNILSTAKLREKYDQLVLKMREESGNGNSKWFQERKGASW